MTLKQLVEHYIKHELPRMAFSTQCVYQSMLKSWIVPKWGNHQLREVKAVQVEEWLLSMPRKNGTKSKIRNIMCSLFSCVTLELYQQVSMTVKQELQARVVSVW